MAHIKKRGQSYYACWLEPDGRERKKSCGKGPEGERLAGLLCRRVEAELLLGTYQARPKNPKWADFLKEYRERVIEPQSLENAEMHLNAVERFGRITGLKRIAMASSRDVERFIAMRKQDKGRDRETVSPSTVNKDLTYIETLLRTAHEWGVLAKVPKITKLREPERIKTYINEEEFALIYKACPDNWWRAFLLFQFMTGWRFKQVLKLRWYAVDLERGEILSDAHDNKGKRDVLLPLHDVLKQALAALKPESTTDFVFGYKGDLYPRFQAIQKRAGITPRNKLPGRWYSFHDLRRGFATVNASRLDLFELQKLMQHRDLKTTRAYVEMAHRLRPAVEKIHVPELSAK